MYFVCNKGKKKDRQKKILFINAVNEVKRESAFSYLTDDHIATIHRAFVQYKNIEGFAKVVSIKDVLVHNGNLNIPLYVSNAKQAGTEKETKLGDLLADWQESSDCIRNDFDSLFKMIEKEL